MFFLNLKIAVKMIAIFASLIIVMIVTAAVSYQNLEFIQQSRDATRLTSEVLETLQKLIISMADQETGLRGYLLAEDTRFLEPYREGQKSYETNVARLKSIMVIPAQLIRLDELDRAARSWRTDIAEREIALMGNSDTKVQARALVAGGAGKAAMDMVRAKAEEIDKVARDILPQRLANEVAAFSVSRLSSIIGIAVVLFLICVTGAILIRTTAGPINGLTAVMGRLAEGDMSIKVPALGRKDEVGLMAAAVQVFKETAIRADTLGALAAATRAADEQRAALAVLEADRTAAAERQAVVVTAVATGLAHLSDGDLTFRLTDAFAPDYEKLRIDFNTAMDQMQTAITAIVTTASTIRIGSMEITQASDELSRRTEQQAASLEETAAALGEITSTVRKTADGSAQARGVVSTAKGDAEHSGDIVRDAVSAMTEIEKSAQQISQIIGVIDEIAFQTNLLALNAGVEAARAGDAGRGFAVVASEVRALAQRSAEAAKEIKALISTSSQQVGRGVGLVGETGETLSRIVAQVTRINGLVVDIAGSAQEQATSLVEINAAVSQMDQVTQQNAALVEETTAASHTLAREAEELARQTGRFQVGLIANVEPTRKPDRTHPAAQSTHARKPLRAARDGGAPAHLSVVATQGWTEF